MTTIVQAGQKRPCDAKGASVVVESFLSNHEGVLQPSRKVKLDPIALGNKMLSSGGGLDIRLSEMNPRNPKPIWVESYKYLPTGERKVWHAQDIPGNMPAPIVIAIGSRPGSEDLGGVSKIPTTNAGDDVHKITFSGISGTKHNVVAGADGYGSDARHLTYAENANRMAVTPDGVIHIAYCRMNGANENAYHAYSSDGGLTWSEERIDDSWSGNQFYACIAMDKLGTLFFCWGEYDTVDASRRVIRLRTKDIAGTWGAVERASTVLADGPWNLDPCITMKPDGETLGLTWVGQGYSTVHVTGFQCYYRERSSAGVYTHTELVDDTAEAGVRENRRPSLSYGPDGVAHIVWWEFYGHNVYYRNNTNVVAYMWDNGAAAYVVNADHVDAGMLNTNIVVDLNNLLHICYLYDTGSQYDLIYRTRASDGTWTDAVVIEYKVQPSQIQANAVGDLMFVFPTKNYSTEYALAVKLLPAGGSLSHVTIYDDRSATSKRVLTCVTLWDKYPLINGTYQHIMQQGAIFLYTVFDSGSLTPGDLVFFASPDALLGTLETPLEPLITQTYVTRRRGYISIGKKELLGKPLIH